MPKRKLVVSGNLDDAGTAAETAIMVGDDDGGGGGGKEERRRAYFGDAGGNSGLMGLAFEERKRGYALRFKCSDVAAISGISQYANIPEIFMQYMYQDLEWLLLEDAAMLGLRVVTEEERTGELAAKIGQKANAAINKLVANARAPHADGEKLRTEANKIVAASKNLSELEAVELLDGVRYKLFTEVGKTSENDILNLYEKQTGESVRYRNEELRAMVFPSRQRLAKNVDGSVVLKRWHTRGLQRVVSDVEEVARALRSVVGKCVREWVGSQRDDRNSACEYSIAKTKDVHFLLVGICDGVSDVVSFDSGGNVCLESAVIEAKTRTKENNVKIPPAIRDQLQVFIYGKMLRMKRGRLLQYVSANQVDGGGKVTVYDVSFEGPPFYHSANWTANVIPRLYSFASAVYAYRGDDHLRYRFLAASDHEKEAILRQVVPKSFH